MLLFIAAAIAVAAVSCGGVTTFSPSRNASLLPQSSDEETIAIVQGFPVTRGDVRIETKATMYNNPNITEQQATTVALDAIVEMRAAVAEAQRLGINASTDGYAMYIEAKSVCEDPEEGQGCRQFLEYLGYSQEEFWENALPKYIEQATVTKLSWKVVEDSGLINASYQQQGQAWDSYKAQLRINASIEWQDPSLETIYTSQN